MTNNKKKSGSVGTKNPAAVALGRRGGVARARALSPERRSEIARIAAAAAKVAREKRENRE